MLWVLIKNNHTKFICFLYYSSLENNWMYFQKSDYVWDGWTPWRSQYFKSPHLRKQYSDQIHFQGQTQEPYFELDPTLHPSASLPPLSQRTKLTTPGTITSPVRMPALLFLSRWVSTQKPSWSVWKIRHLKKCHFPDRNHSVSSDCFHNKILGCEHSSTSSLFRSCYLPLAVDISSGV